jgi:hypothetical protein
MTYPLTRPHSTTLCQSSVPNLEKLTDLRGSSLDFDPDVLCLPQTGHMMGSGTVQGLGSGSGSGSGNGHHRYEGQGQGQGLRSQNIYSSIDTPTACGYNPRQGSNNSNSHNSNTTSFDSFKEKEKQHSDPNLSRRDEEAHTHDFFQGGKSSLPASHFNRPLSQNGRGNISSSSLNNTNNDTNNNSNNSTTSNFDTKNINNNSNGCAETRGSDYFPRPNNNISNIQRIQNFSNFQLLSRPPQPPSQRAIAVVLASIKVCILCSLRACVCATYTCKFGGVE